MQRNQLREYTAAIAPRFQTWKREVKQISTAEAEFAKWLFIQVAGVLLSDKAGELLTLPHDQFGLSDEQRMAHIERLAKRWQCAQLRLCASDFSTKVIVYRTERVQQALDEVPRYLLEGKLGYQRDISAEAFLAEVSRRWQRDEEIPHEIGLALGYPVNDVLGFMGLLPLDCIGYCGWRIYDDVSHAMQISQQFLKARQQATVFLAVP